MFETKKIRIDGLKNMNLKNRLICLLSNFGIIWLLIEPTAYFKISNKIESLSYLGYFLILIFSFLITFIYDFFNLKIKRSRIEYFTLKILSKRRGMTYEINTPINLIIEEFLFLYFQYIIEEGNDKEIEYFIKNYDAKLFKANVNQNDYTEIECDNRKTFFQEKFGNNDFAIINFKIKKYRSTINFMKVSRQQ